MSDLSGEEFDQSLQVIADSRLTGYFAGAALCVLIYDHIICSADEVELMWNSRWGLPKIIYFWNRYFSLIAVGLDTSGGITCVVSSHFVLMLRVWILFGRRKWLIWFFTMMAIAEVVVMFVDSLSTVATPPDRELQFLTKNHYADVPRFLTTSIMFVMTLYKCGMTLLRSDHRVMPVWKLFLRDGVVWFLAVFLAGGAELLIWTSRRESLKQLLIVPALVVYSIVSSRALLNIKEIASRESAELQRNDLTLESGNPIVFASA
ncbi:hypothetical protein C8J57DRAFT_1533928 [Mycena rebaudengoi]|nr:hypothetical protein C8J57DRAFT_1533928 [Mycena rebaudengoi]